MSGFNPLSAIKRNLSAEKVNRVERYIDLLFQWNKRINLTSRYNTREKIYDFVCEGIALSSLIGSKEATIVDVGSGAGFPGIILTICGHQDVNLVEIRSKRAAFMSYVIAELGLKAKVHNCDIRALTLTGVDIITSKAVTSTEAIIQLCKNVTGENKRLILCRKESFNSSIKVQDFDGGVKNYRFVCV